MQIFLLLLGIILALATLASSGLSALFLYAYFNTLDGSYDMYQMQKFNFVLFCILAILLLISTIICFKYRKKLKNKAAH